ncbi:MAG: hypothetical protein R2712_18065 [Vicinamibacterales bacterium]
MAVLLVCAALSDRMAPAEATSAAVQAVLAAEPGRDRAWTDPLIPPTVRDPIVMLVVGAGLIGLGSAMRRQHDDT